MYRQFGEKPRLTSAVFFTDQRVTNDPHMMPLYIQHVYTDLAKKKPAPCSPMYHKKTQKTLSVAAGRRTDYASSASLGPGCLLERHVGLAQRRHVDLLAGQYLRDREHLEPGMGPRR